MAGRLPIDESSGIAIDSDGIIWTHDDSGGQNKIFAVTETGSLIRTIEIKGQTNIDWEELTRDSDGNIYIGDFGNNSNNRTNLRIHVIPDPATIFSDTIRPMTIFYSYEDQTSFPQPASQMHYDLEAFIAKGDSLYLFTKNRTSPMNGWTRLYRLPKTPGTYEAELIDSFFLSFIEMEAQVTSADILDDVLLIMSYRKIWIFQGFSGSDFFSVEPIVLDFSSITQKEAICFMTGTEGENRVWITDERVTVYGIPIGGNLYALALSSFILSLNETLPSENLFEKNILAYPNPFNSMLNIAPHSNPVEILMLTVNLLT
jgi:hypothetical protein